MVVNLPIHILDTWIVSNDYCLQPKEVKKEDNDFLQSTIY